MKTTPNPLPTDLKILAFLAIAFGILSAIGWGIEYNFGPVKFRYIGALGILFGVGLLRFWRLCRWCMIGISWLYLLTLPLMFLFLVLVIIYAPPLKLEIFDHPVGGASGWISRAFGAVLALLTTALWFASFWALRVLRRPDVALLFARVPKPLAVSDKQKEQIS